MSSTLLKEIDFDQPIVFLPSDHLIENTNKFITEIKNNKNKLNNDNIFLFGIKPTSPSSQYGYIITKKAKNSIKKLMVLLKNQM